MKTLFDHPRDLAFREQGFLVFREGEIYGKQLTLFTHLMVYLDRQTSKWCVHRFHTQNGNEKVLVETKSAPVALKRAQDYVNWYQENVRK